MSNSILEALFYGKIAAWERECIRTPEHRELNRKIDKAKQHFAEKMSPDDYQHFQELINCYEQANDDNEIDIYLHGFTLGSLIMVEVMEKRRAIVNE